MPTSELAWIAAGDGDAIALDRDAFLPGVWDDLKAPNLPIERWKLPLYDNAPLDGRVLPLRPLHELFAVACQLVRAGAGPAFKPVPPVRGAR